MKKSFIAIIVFVMMFGFFPMGADWNAGGMQVYAAESAADVVEDQTLLEVLTILVNYQKEKKEDFYNQVENPDTTDIRNLPIAADYKKEISIDDLEDYPSTVNLAPYTDISTLAGLNYAKQTESVRLPKNLGTIETKAFYEMVGLEVVTMPASVHEIKDSAFEKCEKLVRINTYEYEDANNIIHLENVYNIGISAFASCVKIQEVKLCDSKSGKNIKSKAFSSCTRLARISTVPNVNLGTGIFTSCHSLEAIIFEEGIKKIPDNTLTDVVPEGGIEVNLPTTLTDIGFYAFEGSRIKSINIDACPDLAWIGDYAFQYAEIHGWNNSFTKNTKLKTICQHAFAGAVLDDMDMTLPDSVTEMGISVFFSTTGLKSINIPVNMASIPAGTFMCCYDLESVTVPKDAKFEYVGEHAFDMCGKLSNTDFLKNSTELKTIKKYAFARCVPKKADYADGTVTGLTRIDIPSGVKTIEPSAFENDFMVEQAYFGEGVTDLPARLMICEDSTTPTFSDVTLEDPISKEEKTYPFSGNQPAYRNLRSQYTYDEYISRMSALKTAYLSKSLTAIGNYAFFGNSSLELMTYNTKEGESSVDNFKPYYSNKEKKPGLYFSDTLTFIGSSAFAYCAKDETTDDGILFTGIQNVFLPDSLTGLMSNTFQGDFNLDTVILSSSITKIPAYCFSDCGFINSDDDGNYEYYGLRVISDLSSMEAISDYAFNNCCNLATVITTNGEDYITFGKKLTKLGQYAFYGSGIERASSLSFSKIETIEPYTFYECRNLEMVNCPDSLTSIEDSAFGYCPKLYDINFPVYATLSETMIEGDEQDNLTLSPTLGKYRGKTYIVPMGLTVSLPATAFARCRTEKISQVDPVTHKDVELSKADPRYFDVVHEDNAYKITGGNDQVEGTACRISASVAFEDSPDRTMNIDYPVDVIPVSANQVDFVYDDFKIGGSKAGQNAGTEDSPILYVDSNKKGSTLTLVAAAKTEDGSGVLTDTVDWKVTSGSSLTLKAGSVTQKTGDEACITTAQFNIKDKGSAKVKVVFSNGSEETVSKVIDVTVIDAISSVDYYLDYIGSNHLNPDVIEMPVSQVDKVSSKTTYSNGDDKRDFVTYSSSDENVVRIDKDGQITALAPGTADVIISTASGSVTQSITITVKKKGETIDPAYIDISGPMNAAGQGYVYLGETAVFSANRFPIYASNGVEWSTNSSTNASMAASGNKAELTGKVANGTVTLRARSLNGTAASSIKVIVIRKADSLTFLEESPTIQEGKTSSLRLSSKQDQEDGIIRKPEDSWQDVKFTSSDKSILRLGESSDACNDKSVTLSGSSATLYYKGVKAGTATITAETETGAKAVLTVTVISQPISKISCSNSNVTLMPGKKTQMKLSTTPAKTSETISFQSSNTKVATVDKDGNITAVAAGTADITATTKVKKLKTTCKVTVLKVGQTFTASGYTYKVNKGNTLTLSSVPTGVKKVKVPATVTISDNSYKVTKIGASVSSGRKSLTSLTIGKNVTSIGKKAFYNCPKLGKVTISTKKLTKVGKAAFKGDKKGMTFKCPKDKVNKYKKMIKKSGVPKNSKFKKK